MIKKESDRKMFGDIKKKNGLTRTDCCMGAVLMVEVQKCVTKMKMVPRV